MTAELFMQRHGENWLKFKTDPMWTDLVDYIRTLDPARLTPNISAKDSTEHSAHLLGRIAGFQIPLNAVESLSIQQQTAPPQEKWEPDQQ